MKDKITVTVTEKTIIELKIPVKNSSLVNHVSCVSIFFILCFPIFH